MAYFVLSDICLSPSHIIPSNNASDNSNDSEKNFYITSIAIQPIFHISSLFIGVDSLFSEDLLRMCYAANFHSATTGNKASYVLRIERTQL